MSRLFKTAALPIAIALTVDAPATFRAAATNRVADGHPIEGAGATPWNTAGVPATNRVADGHAIEGAGATPWNTEGVPAINTGTTVETITVHGPSLVGNLAGDSADRRVIVYLPPSYGERKDERY